MISTQGIKEILMTFRKTVMEKIRIETTDWSNTTSGLSNNFILHEIMCIHCRQGTILDKIYYQQPIIIGLYSFSGYEGPSRSYLLIAEASGNSSKEAFNKLVSKL